jgi:hypothetical protein
MSLEGERLRDAVTSRAKEIGRRTDALLAAAGGPSTTTMTKLRHGDYRPRHDTMEKFDTALKWEPGSAWRVWNGGEPTPDGTRQRSGADDGLVEFELTNQHGVRVVVKGPVRDQAALEASVVRLIRGLDDS